MSNSIGNQKHLTLSQRIIIEKSLADGKSFSAIAKEIHKSPSTISKEIRKHTQIKERKNLDFAPIPCALRSTCEQRYLCDDNCGALCRICKKKGQKCNDVCPVYAPMECERLKKPPYVCNSCSKRANGLMQRRIYSSKYAEDTYRNMLVTSREGINQTPESIQKMNDLLTPLIKKGQSIAHIYATHAEELECSRRTAYSYIHSGVFDVRTVDLRRAVKYKPRCISTETSTKDRAHRKGRNYENYEALAKTIDTRTVVEMDTVVGCKSDSKVFLTMLFRNCNLMLIFLLDRNTQSEIKRFFDFLTEELGLELFKHLFSVILTDGGSEFQDVESLESTETGEKRCSIYYCDSYSSWQKSAIEKNHEYIRYVIPKGVSFDKLTKEKTVLLMNHINNEARDSLNGHSPFTLSQLLLDKKLHEVLNLKKIEPDEVTLIPSLLK